MGSANTGLRWKLIAQKDGFPAGYYITDLALAADGYAAVTYKKHEILWKSPVSLHVAVTDPEWENPSGTKLVHCKKEPYDVYIGRVKGGDSGPWGNPYTLHNESYRIQVIENYGDYMLYRLTLGKLSISDVTALAGKTLGCWCWPKPCHGDVLIDLINNPWKMQASHGYAPKKYSIGPE